jgi:hypothetical protein
MSGKQVLLCRDDVIEAIVAIVLEGTADPLAVLNERYLIGGTLANALIVTGIEETCADYQAQGEFEAFIELALSDAGRDCCHDIFMITGLNRLLIDALLREQPAKGTA